ncbi:Ankyrin repeat domain-containing protein [Bordetella tumbae]|uniref:ankyrin repeat domain-containing protein n=1 Tax=Bordetella tumbae TaxID=1649139 RepID=UPI0039F027F2
MMIANSFVAATDSVSDLFARSGIGMIPDDNAEMERVQAHLMVCVYAKDASGVRAIFAKNDTEKLIASLRAPRYFPVHAASASDSGAVLSALVDILPAEALDVRDENGLTPLMCAARHGHVAAIHTLLAGKASVDATDQSGYSALMWAAMSGFVDAVKVLLGYEVYADDSAQPVGVDRQDNNGDTALVLAIRAGHYDVVESLVARRANINTANAEGECALSVAVALGRRRAIRLLCEQRDIDLNAIDRAGLTVMMRAADYADRTYDSSILNLLIGQNARTDLKDRDGCSALLRAAKGQSDIAIEHLIAGGADIHATDSNGCSALALAAKHNNLYGLRFLLKQRGVWVDARDHSGRTPLFHAVENENYDMVNELIMHGANSCLSYTVIDGTVLTLAQRRGDRRMVKLLLDKGAGNDIKDMAALPG